MEADNARSCASDRSEVGLLGFLNGCPVLIKQDMLVLEVRHVGLQELIVLRNAGRHSGVAAVRGPRVPCANLRFTGAGFVDRVQASSLGRKRELHADPRWSHLFELIVDGSHLEAFHARLEDFRTVLHQACVRVVRVEVPSSLCALQTLLLTHATFAALAPLLDQVSKEALTHINVRHPLVPSAVILPLHHNCVIIRPVYYILGVQPHLTEVLVSIHVELLDREA
mmetsp:Transcript_8389/g.18320  ORF Transcript_8389/g.18320 Transcript_8389/m.18320 type:complete len:225 (-) Transcript_8389:607-1281(-)